MVDTLYPKLGMVIPTYFSGKASSDNIRELFALTMDGLEHYVMPEHIQVVIDGDERSLAAAQEYAAAQQNKPFELTVLSTNAGKLGAIRAGLARLCEQCSNIEHFIIRDCDGDHLPDAIPTFMRMAQELRERTSNGRYLIAGARTSRHHPMGWMRGELETVLDAVTVDSLAFHLAKQNRVPDLTLCSHTRNVPDISSGYKLYSLQLVKDVFLTEQYTGCLTTDDYYHLAPETAPFVEATLQGALFAEIERSTTNGQPTTSFGEFEHAHLYGRLLAWTWNRMGIPLSAGLQMLDNRTAKSLLGTTNTGVEAITRVRQLVIELLSKDSTQTLFQKRRRRSFV